MCGLYGGFSSFLSDAEKKSVENLAITSQLRGVDSSGFFTVHKDKNKLRMNLVKDASPIVELLRYKEPDEAFFKSGNILIAGHSRAATVGLINDKNAHPFSIDHIVGMHNGTVLGMPNKSLTDSEQILTILAKDGLEEAVKAAKFGAYALVWLDRKKETLNFLRNEQRTLFFMHTTHSTFYWSSEYLMLEFMRARYYAGSSSCKISLLAPHKHLSVCIHTGTTTETNAEPSKSFSQSALTSVPSTKAVVPFEADKKKEKKEVLQKTGIASSSTTSPSTKYKPIYVGFRGKSIEDPKTVEEILISGCSLCDSVCSEDDTVFFISNKTYICNDCKSDEFISETYKPGELWRSFYKVKGQSNVSCG